MNLTRRCIVPIFFLVFLSGCTRKYSGVVELYDGTPYSNQLVHAIGPNDEVKGSAVSRDDGTFLIVTNALKIKQLRIAGSYTKLDKPQINKKNRLAVSAINHNAPDVHVVDVVQWKR